jgi:hypothetical protein
MSRSEVPPGRGEPIEPPSPLRSLSPDRFIVSPLFDSLFFIGSPLIAIAVVLGAWQFFPATTVEGHVLLYMAVGHHVPTFFRAYGDPDEFARNRMRLLLIPVLVLGLVGGLSLLGARTLYLLFIWDQFHFVRQHYGFMRIYDAKNASTESGRLNLDLWLCFAAFAFIIASSDFYAFVYTVHFDDLAIGFPAWIGPLLWWGSGGLTLVLGVLYVGNLFRRMVRGQPISLLKLLIFATTYGTWYFAYVVLDNETLSYPISSFFHCFQYDALAWYYNRKKASSLDPKQGNRVFRYLHSGRGLWLYLLSIFGYGFLSQQGLAIAPGVVIAINRVTAVLHYYFDGFIWRVRRADFRRFL